MSRKLSPTKLLAGLVVVLGLLVVVTGRTQTLAEAVPATCRALHLFSPTPPDDIQPFVSGWEKQSDFNTQVGPTLSRYRAKYPDFDIHAVPGSEDERSGPFHSNVERKYHGTFVAKPKWKGLFAIIGDMINTSKLTAGLLLLIILGALIVMLVSRRSKRNLSAS